ncbi:MAG: transglycosylase family protein [Solirubrobacteraceae bacterium]
MTATTAVLGLLALLATFPARSSAGPSLGSLNQQLNQQQAHQQQLRSALSRLAGLISSLSSQISLVEQREAAVSAQLAHDRHLLAVTQIQLRRQRRLVALLRARLARARMLLTRQLVSNYEAGSPDLVSAVLQSNGFTDLLDRIKFLSDAEHQQQRTIAITRADKARADAAVKRLAKLQKQQRDAANAAAVEARALAGMNQLLHSKEASLENARAVQQSALSASESRAGAIESQISHIEAQQAAQRAAAQRAAAQQAAQQQAAAPSSSAPALGASGGWSIPYPIVQCESGGQNLPPNYASASGYYQILASTWSLYGGSGPAAYLASKAEQDAVASRIWAGQGPSAWVCAGIVGIH